MGQALKDDGAALPALTDAEDEAALEQAVGQLNASATSLLTTVNEELAERSRPRLEAVGALVYQAGLTYLRQRRFDALKQAVNENDAVVATAADLLAEATFRSEEHTSELQSLMRISYAVFCLNTKKNKSIHKQKEQ